MLDRAALRAADVVWNVSERITERRSRQGVPDADNVSIPNAPSFDPSLVLPYEARTPESVVMVGSLDPILDETMLLDCLELLLGLRPNVAVTIVGTGSGADGFRAEVVRRGLEENVRLTGHLPRTEALSVVRDSRVGLAFYSGRATWNEYGDSVKVREYLASGVPVVTTRNHAVAPELEWSGAGVLVDDAIQAATAIDALLGGAGAEAARRAAAMGQAYDRDAILGRAVADLARRLRS